VVSCWNAIAYVFPLSTFQHPYISELFSSLEPGTVIVYTGTRRDPEETAEFVHDVVRIPAGFYHTGLPAEERTRIQNEFISGKLNVIAPPTLSAWE
jgi:superfamily II DNA helicase RecQ